MTVVTMKRSASIKDIGAVLRTVESLGFTPHVQHEDGATRIGLIGEGSPDQIRQLLSLPGVAGLEPVATPYKLGSRNFRKAGTEVYVGDIPFGGEEVVVIAGPCAVESREQMMITARAVAGSGGLILRGGAFKPRTSPYSFRGLGREGLEILAETRKETGCPVVTEVLTPADAELVAQYADMLQIGARNMQNYSLLEAVGRIRKPVLLKRGLMATIEEFLLAAEYILAAGNPNIILCERGVRGFEQYTRNALDIAAVPLLKKLSHLPVIVDPSHATGRRDLVIPVALAAVAAGADGLIVEVHHDPDHAMSDGAQSLNLEQFDDMMSRLIPLSKAVDRRIRPTSQQN
ncbi:MAG: 3-deoxy-7-phosphoheptulonate synthase [candidate division Zixibacteria bacterium]|nr:3-deoxy-7-phosphoheptulonate synthase [candidate division Zixibacteria bacterium]